MEVFEDLGTPLYNKYQANNTENQLFKIEFFKYSFKNSLEEMNSLHLICVVNIFC